MSTLRATAYHEAGHAVIAVLLDVGFEKVTINGDERAAGRIIYVNPEPEIREARGGGDRDDPRVKQSAKNALIVTLAGAIAQRRFSPRSDWRFGSTVDQKNVTDRIADLGYTGEDAETFQKVLEKCAEALVRTSARDQEGRGCPS